MVLLLRKIVALALLAVGPSNSPVVVARSLFSSPPPSPPTIPREYNFDVDLVFTLFVPYANYRAEVAKTCQTKKGRSPQRFRDTGVFAVALQSAVYHLPWLRRIFVVTSHGERPCWYNSLTLPEVLKKKIHFLSHKDIWDPGNLDALPTFNSLAIEANLHRIPGLAEHYIYLNDDFLVGPQVLPKSTFFTKDGRPIIPARNHGDMMQKKDSFGQHGDMDTTADPEVHVCLTLDRQT